ncbi:MAG: DNA polymerase III subunit delta' [Alphaproteobacteria bacterium]
MNRDGPANDVLPPRETPTLIGHAAAERALLQALRSGRMPHAWLIGGPKGIGKATLAFRFARFVLAGSATASDGLFGDSPPATLELRSDHPVFRRVAAGGHADLLTVERRRDEKTGKLPTDVPVDAVRRIAPFLHLTAAEGGWRVVVVDEAERMNRSSANAILKVLEEPPARALILLVSSNPGALAPTIRSRCRRLLLDSLPEEAVAAHLQRYATALTPADRLAVARLADGSPGRALALVEAGGLELYRSLIGLLATLPDLDLVRLHKLGDRLGPAAAEAAYRTAVGLLDWWLTRLIRAIARGDAAADAVAGEADLMRRLGAGPPHSGGLDRWLEVWEKTHHLFARADSANLDRKQVILQAFMSLEVAARA